MLSDKSNRDYNNVLGVTYKEAKDLMEVQEHLISNQAGKGFASRDLCEKFARDNHMDVTVYMKSLGTFRSVSHRGDSLTHAEWNRLYRDILYYSYETNTGDTKIAYYDASGYHNLIKAKIFGEQADGKYQPLYYRDYFVPTGYYSEERGAFNSARSFTTFARQTGADTEHIYTLLKALAGECYPYLLSWLRHKLIYPTKKIEVIPIFTGSQGTGKSTFGEVICKALFEQENVIVSYQFDSGARFNADQADALVVCIEEKTQEDKRNTASMLKSSATATQVRKENKGVDPYYQDSHTAYVMSTNEVVPIKFEDRDNQRRFMIMEVDPDFTRDKSALADEVFTRLYGYDGNGNEVTTRLVDDKAAIEQFKYELLHERDTEGVNYRQFPKTDAYHRCFNIPRTGESIEVETTIKALAPFIKESLLKRTEVDRLFIEDDGEVHEIFLDGVIHDTNAMQFVSGKGGRTDRLAICKQLVFSNAMGQALSPSVVDRVLLDMRKWLLDLYNLTLLADTNPPSNGFKNIHTKVRTSPAAWFALKQGGENDVSSTPKVDVSKAQGTMQNTNKKDTAQMVATNTIQPESRAKITVPTRAITERIGQRARYNHKFLFDPDGEFETLNEIRPKHYDACMKCYSRGNITMALCKACPHNRRKETAAYMDTFLLESDTVSKTIEAIEDKLAATFSPDDKVEAEVFYAGRLKIQESEAIRLFNSKQICRVVYSGSKSIHMLVRIQDSPRTLDERVWLDAYLKSTLSDRLVFDASTKDPTRLTRSPVEKERITTYKSYQFKIIGEQRLLQENWDNVLNINWRGIYEAWKNAPLSSYEQRGKLLPSKPIYHEAVKSILDETYFIDRRWAGMRQETFFPAYRLLRAMGYSTRELWRELNKQIDSHYQRDQIEYWKSRQTSDIIKSIDREYDEN